MKMAPKLALKWRVRVENEDGMFSAAEFTFSRMVGPVQVKLNQAVKEFADGRRIDAVYPVEDNK